jgi:hypothetical protein
MLSRGAKDGGRYDQADEIEATAEKAFAAKATDLQALRDAVVDAASSE